jgi:hypothetical protein
MGRMCDWSDVDRRLNEVRALGESAVAACSAALESAACVPAAADGIRPRTRVARGPLAGVRRAQRALNARQRCHLARRACRARAMQIALIAWSLLARLRGRRERAGDRRM